MTARDPAHNPAISDTAHDWYAKYRREVERQSSDNAANYLAAQERFWREMIGRDPAAPYQDALGGWHKPVRHVCPHCHEEHWSNP